MHHLAEWVPLHGVRYPWSGEVVLHNRRDKRRGQHRGSVSRTGEGGGCIQYASRSWVAPLLHWMRVDHI